MTAKENLLKIVYDRCSDHATHNFNFNGELEDHFDEINTKWKECSEKYAEVTDFYNFELDFNDEFDNVLDCIETSMVYQPRSISNIKDLDKKASQ